MHQEFTYGPVPSRRLGASLGIDITKSKTCSFNCIYCQVGSTICLSARRGNYSPIDAVLAEIQNVIIHKKRIDFLTFSGSGEPTLHRHLGRLIDRIKKMTKIPIAVITNGSLLYLPGVQKDLVHADIVLPTLCAATDNTFKRIHRPNPCLNLRRLINGMIKFRKGYPGKIWLEIMLIKSYNDTLDEIQKLKKIVERIDPDRIQLNTVIRPPSEAFARPLTAEELKRIRKIFGRQCEIIADFKPRRSVRKDIGLYDLILCTVRRRPVTTADIARVTGINERNLTAKLRDLRIKGFIKTIKHQGREFHVKK